MRRCLLLLSIGVVSLALLPSCGGSDEPSYTDQLCSRLESALAAADVEGAAEVVGEMATLPTEEEVADGAEVVEPEIYAPALLAADGLQNETLSMSSLNTYTGLLREECAKLIGDSGDDTSPVASPVLTRGEIVEGVATQLNGLISDLGLPYVITSEPSFNDVTAEDVSGTPFQPGTLLEIPIELPKRIAANDLQTVVYGPLELVAEGIRPYVDQMEFVDFYFVPVRLHGSSSPDSFMAIYPEEMRRYLDGEISVKELADEITLYG